MSITRPTLGQVYNLIIGDRDTNVSCVATGISAPVMNLTRHDGIPINTIAISSVLLDSGLYQSETRLDADTVSESMDGFYACTASNELESVVHPFAINTRGKL